MIRYADVAGDTVCYGYPLVDAKFTDDQDTLVEPGDQAALTWLEILKGSAFNLENDEWGVSLVDVDAFVDGFRVEPRVDDPPEAHFDGAVGRMG